jgi:hypothetical protein
MTKEEAFELIETIKKMSDSEAIAYGKKHIKGIMDDAADKYGRYRISNERRKGNNWNSLVEGVYRNEKGTLFVDIYFQDDSTDTNDSEYFDTFFSSASNVRVTSRLGSAVYSYDERAEVMRSIVIDYIYWKVIDREKIERAEKIEKLKDYRIVNPILNKFYNDNRLGYKTHLYMYGKECVEYDAYTKGKKDLDAYIVSNVDNLDGKTNEELTSIYTEVFNNAANEYFRTH